MGIDKSHIVLKQNCPDYENGCFKSKGDHQPTLRHPRPVVRIRSDQPLWHNDCCMLLAFRPAGLVRHPRWRRPTHRYVVFALRPVRFGKCIVYARIHAPLLSNTHFSLSPGVKNNLYHPIHWADGNPSCWPPASPRRGFFFTEKTLVKQKISYILLL